MRIYRVYQVSIERKTNLTVGVYTSENIAQVIYGLVSMAQPEDTNTFIEETSLDRIPKVDT